MGRRAHRVGLLVLMLLSALLLARFVAGNVEPLADQRVYVDASRSLFEEGDPYARNAGLHFEHHYRYPPMLALAMPVLRWIWFPLLALGLAVPLILRFRTGGLRGLLFPIHLGGTLLGNLVNGNAQGVVMGLTSLAPIARIGPPLVAVAAWIKLYPALVVVWWLGRRDLVALRRFGITFVALGLVQLPWLPEFVEYSRTQTGIPSQLSLRSLGPVVWVMAIAALAVVTFVRARREDGWRWCVLLQVVTLPRLLVYNLPLLLMDPRLATGAYDPLLEGVRRPRWLVTGMAVVVATGFGVFAAARFA
jgi:hypothetical protein